jgi:MFS family permease
VVIGIQSLMSPESFNAWGWRLPFLSSAVLVFFSYIVRRRMEETPVFNQLKNSGNVSKSPIRESLDSFPKWRLILMLIFGGNAAQSAIMQTSQFVTLYFLQRAVKIEEQLSFIILATALLLGTPFFQWAGALSDRIGRKKVIYAGIVLGMISIPLSFYLFNTLGNPGHLTETHSISTGLTLLFILLCFINMLSSALVYGPMGVFMTEFFEGRTRYTSMGFAHNIGNGVIGGGTPLVTEFLKANLVVGALFAPYIGLLYPLGLVVLALIINPFLKETAGKN